MSGATADAVRMTLAGIAYGAPDRIPRYLTEAELLGGEWTVAWMPVESDPPDNFAFLTKRAGAGSPEYVLAIRGTYPDPFSRAYWDDGSQDSPFGEMAEWPGAKGARISRGTSEALQNLLALRDASGVSLEGAVQALPSGAALAVTGHSLGGTVAPVLGLQLAQGAHGVEVEVTTFAGMTPGNEAFAALFSTGSVLDGRVRRVFNTLDTVSYGWDRVYKTHDFYDPAPKGGVAVSALLLATAMKLRLGGYDYATVGDPVPLEGVLRKEEIGCSLIAYLLETLHQHMPDTYLELLGAPKLPFSILFGTVVAPREREITRPPRAGLIGGVVRL